MSKVFSYLGYSLLWLVSLLPIRFLYIFSDILYVLNKYFVKYREKVVLTNLANSFPEKTNEDIQQIKKAFYHHLCDFLIESIKMISISKRNLDKRYEYKNEELIHELQKEGKNISIISGHYGNWEWAFRFPSKIKNDFIVIYQPLKNQRTNQMFVNVRGRFGTKLIPMKNFYKVLVDKYKRNEPCSVYFLGDQRPAGEKKIHFWRKFLNQDTGFFMGPEKVARKYNHAVVFMDIQKQKRGKYVTSFELLFKDGAETKQHDIINSFVDKLESVIKEKPEHWLWSHKRWKNA